MLKKIVGTDGKIAITPRVEKFIREHDKPEIQQEFIKFKSDIADKIIELLNEEQKGVRISQDSEFKYSIVFNQEVIEIDSRVPINQELRTKINSIIAANTLFRCGFIIKGEKETIEQHSFFIKKKLDGNFLLIEPHGKSFGSRTSVFSRAQYNFLKQIFNIPEQRDFEQSTCPLQGNYNTCALWTILFFMYSDKTFDEIFNMLRNTAELFHPSLRNKPFINDLILLLIFDKFLNEGFATDAEIAAYTPGQLNGLGKCKKCGLPKA